MSVILRKRWAMLFATTVAVVAIAGYLIITLGVLSGARTTSGPVAISAADAAASSVSGSTPAASATPTPVPSASAKVKASKKAAPVKKAAKKTAAAKSGSASMSAASAGSTTSAASAASTKARTGTSRRVTFNNRTTHEIWVAGWQQTAKPALAKSGWALPAGKSVTITVADKWNGRFWGRTGCKFNAAGKGHCVTGDCAGVFQCKGYGAIPATLAEFNFNAWQHLDFYDVSMVDGSNGGMWINHTGGTKDAISKQGCIKAGCATAVPCPTKLKVDGGSACESPCAKLGGDQYCCAGKWAPRSECDPTKWPVDYAKIFKKAEPYAYSYVDDDATSTYTCTGRCDYQITFGITPK